jgi:hypothetical protein
MKPLDIVRLSENEIQRAVFAHIRIRSAPGTFAFHPRNGGQDQRRLAGINSALGVISGVPDVAVIKAGAPFALELKTLRGRLPPDQERVLVLMRAAGCECDVAFGLDDAIAWLEEREILRGEIQ